MKLISWLRLKRRHPALLFFLSLSSCVGCAHHGADLDSLELGRDCVLDLKFGACKVNSHQEVDVWHKLLGIAGELEPYAVGCLRVMLVLWCTSSPFCESRFHAASKIRWINSEKWIVPTQRHMRLMFIDLLSGEKISGLEIEQTAGDVGFVQPSYQAHGRTRSARGRECKKCRALNRQAVQTRKQTTLKQHYARALQIL